jgi:hypothetical protein
MMNTINTTDYDDASIDNDGGYNGWTNYETWRVNLEVFDGVAWLEQFDDGMSVYDASKLLKDYAEELICETSTEGLARDYALAFLAAVNWYEIAQSMHNLYQEECEA